MKKINRRTFNKTVGTSGVVLSMFPEITLGSRGGESPVNFRQHCTDQLSRLFERHPERFERPISEYQLRLDEEVIQIEKFNEQRHVMLICELLRRLRLDGIPIAPGRGSTTCSLVCFVLGITGIDPVRFNLPFSRMAHLHTSYARLDFYIDLGVGGRALAFDHLGDILGHEKVCLVGVRGKTHATWMVAGDQSVFDHLQPDSNSEGQLITYLSTRDIETLGYRVLEVMESEVLDELQDGERAALAVDPQFTGLDGIPFQDEPTVEVLRKLVFPSLIKGEFLEDPASGPININYFEDLCAIYSLYRPGVIAAGMLDDFLAVEPHADLYAGLPGVGDILDDTRAMLIYQEQAIRIFVKYFGLNPIEANQLRTHHSKRLPPNELHAKAVAYGRSNGIEDPVGVLGLIRDLLRYSFCAGHAIAACTTIWRKAYFKAKYPEIFAEHMKSRTIEI